MFRTRRRSVLARVRERRRRVLPLGAPCIVVDVKGAPRDRIDLPFPARGQCGGRTRILLLAPACGRSSNASFVEVYAADVAARLVAEDAAIAFPADALVDTVRSALRLLRVESSSGLTGKALLRARTTLPGFLLLPRRWSVARGAASHLAVAVNIDACGLLEAVQHLLHLGPCCPDFLRHAAPRSRDGAACALSFACVFFFGPRLDETVHIQHEGFSRAQS